MNNKVFRSVLPQMSHFSAVLFFAISWIQLSDWLATVEAHQSLDISRKHDLKVASLTIYIQNIEQFIDICCLVAVPYALLCRYTYMHELWTIRRLISFCRLHGYCIMFVVVIHVFKYYLFLSSIVYYCDDSMILHILLWFMFSFFFVIFHCLFF